MNSNEIDIHKELKKYFGFSQFKGLQKVIQSLLAGQNTFVIMPTGGGNLCYQLPALTKEERQLLFLLLLL
jgi:ATP-dependent DNA helicase RecQ